LVFFSGLHILHDGPCNYKDIVFPKDVTQTCHIADNHVIMMPVCGSNNVTYPNPYVLKCAQHRGIVSSGTSRICYDVQHVYRVFILITVFHRLSSTLLTSITNKAQHFILITLIYFTHRSYSPLTDMWSKAVSIEFSKVFNFLGMSPQTSRINSKFVPQL